MALFPDSLLKKKFLSTREVGDILGKSSTAIKYLIYAQEIRAVKISTRDWSIPVDALLDYLDQHGLRISEDYLSTAEVAEELGISPVTVRSWIHQGRIQGVKKVGKYFYIPKSELTRILLTAYHQEKADRHCSQVLPA
jgi:excisionase family DNA binding protein